MEKIFFYKYIYLLIINFFFLLLKNKEIKINYNKIISKLAFLN